ncbi:MAG: hypothetical protein AAF310_00730 [Myxococcota bacterium]
MVQRLCGLLSPSSHCSPVSTLPLPQTVASCLTILTMVGGVPMSTGVAVVLGCVFVGCAVIVGCAAAVLFAAVLVAAASSPDVPALLFSVLSQPIIIQIMQHI